MPGRLLGAAALALVLATGAEAQISSPPSSGGTSLSPFYPSYTSGNWYLSPGASPATGASIGLSNVTICMPWTAPPGGVTIRGVGVDQTNSTATVGYISAALFYRGANGYPSGSGFIDATNSVATLTSATGPITLTLNNTTDTVAAGQFWVCVAQSSTTPVLESESLSAATNTLLGQATLSAAGTTGIYCTSCGTGGPTFSSPTWTWSGTSTFGGSPNWGSNGTGGGYPAVWLQVN